MIDFELDQEQKMLTDAIRRLAEERITIRPAHIV